MNNTALRAGAQSANNTHMVFANDEHEKFYYEKLEQARYPYLFLIHHVKQLVGKPCKPYIPLHRLSTLLGRFLHFINCGQRHSYSCSS